MDGRERPVGLNGFLSILLVAGVVAAPSMSVTARAQDDQVSDGTDVRINVPGAGETATCNTQSEVTLAGHADTLVAGWIDSGQCELAIEAFARRRLVKRGVPAGPVPTYSLAGYGWSKDRGASWTDGGTIRQPPDWSLIGDPVLATTTSGHFLYATLMASVDGRLTIGVARSRETAEGLTFDAPVDAAPGLNTTTFKDKPWMAVDPNPEPGFVYVAFIEFGTSAPSCGTAARTLWVTRSTDGGASFGSPKLISCELGPGTPQIAVGPEGQVYVSWIVASRILFAALTPGAEEFIIPPTIIAQLGRGPGHGSLACVGWQGPTWLDAGQVEEVLFDGRLPGVPPAQKIVLDGEIRVGILPSMAVDVYGSPDEEDSGFNRHRGNIYLAFARYAGEIFELQEDESSIVFLRSTDGGRTWGPLGATKLATGFLSDGGSRTDQFHAQVEVNPDATVAVSWYDRRHSPRSALGEETNREIDVYAAFSADGGATFSDASPLRVTDRSFLPGMTSPNTGGLAGCYMGEYNGLIPGHPGEFMLAWGDNRDPSPITGFPDPNVYFDRVLYGDSGTEANTCTGSGRAPSTKPGRGRGQGWRTAWPSGCMRPG